MTHIAQTLSRRNSLHPRDSIRGTIDQMRRRNKMRKQSLKPQLLSFALLALSGSLGAVAATPIRVPLTSDHWRIVDDGENGTKPDVQFVRHEGFPQGVLEIKSASAALNGLVFQDGTIEFDMKGLAEDIPGIQFRKQGPEGRQEAEEFYVRTFPDCRASNDCIQYAPVIHGFMLWNFYPEYQASAFILDGWNHIKLVVSGRRMKVYINRQQAPSLAIDSLQGESSQGAIQLRGPAYFANLVVIPDAVEGLTAEALPDPAQKDSGIVRNWMMAPPTALHYGQTPAYIEMPGPAAAWKRVSADGSGMVNLNRVLFRDNHPPPVIWLQFLVGSEVAQQKQVAMGWLGQTWIFVNGKLVTQGKNFYDPDTERRDPDGRLSFENGSFSLPLKAGTNEVVVALFAGVHDNDHTPNRYGWGLGMRLLDARGLQLPGSMDGNRPAGRVGDSSRKGKIRARD